MSKTKKGTLNLIIRLEDDPLDELQSTALDGLWHPKTETFSVPFDGYDNAIDSLRIVIGHLQRAQMRDKKRRKAAGDAT